MAVSKTRKKSPRRKPRGEVKRVPQVYSIKYKFIRGSYKPKLDVVELYINMQVNNENIVVHGNVDPGQVIFRRIIYPYCKSSCWAYSSYSLDQ